MAFLEAVNSYILTHPEAMDLLQFLAAIRWWIFFYLGLYFVYLMEREHEKVWKPKQEELERRKEAFRPQGRLKI